jgi:hypothetical protein
MWEDGGLYGLPFNTTYWWSQSLLLFDTNSTLGGDWGKTTVGLGQASPQSITIAEQWVAMSTSEDFPLGYLGLSVGGISPTGATRPTFLSGLAENSSTIPSSAYGFTAGASYSKLFSRSTLACCLAALQIAYSFRLHYQKAIQLIFDRERWARCTRKHGLWRL